MKYYLITARIVDGEHEHTDHTIIAIKSVKQLNTTIESLFPKAIGDIDADNAHFGYGDGLTASRLESCRKITPTQAKLLESLQIAYVHDFSE